MAMTKKKTPAPKTASAKSAPAKKAPAKSPAKAVVAKTESAKKTPAKKMVKAPSKKPAKGAEKEKDAEGDEAAQGTTAAATKGTLAQIVKKLIAKGKERGYITYDELNAALPAEDFTSEQIEDAMSTMSDVGIQMSDGGEEEAEEEKAEGEYESGGNISSDDTGRTDDPVRMYLREMGSVELLSREGEIAIAKRIEAGRELMIGGICESPLAIESLLAWYAALEKGDILLREVIDLDATYGTPEGATSAPAAAAPAVDDSAEDNAEGGESDDADNPSLAAMEEELKPQVFESFSKRRTPGVCGAMSKMFVGGC